MTDELLGKRIGGYEIIERVGQGGMATVYRAHQLSMNRTVALKILPRHFLNDATYLQRFHREVKIVSQLEHRSIVPVYDYGEVEGQPYIVMRFMSGGSVDDLLRAGALAVQRIVRILDQIAPALDYAHTKDVLHRDLKPSNVLLDDAEGAFLTDFGIARILGEVGGTITTQGVIGTPAYMSPEQAQGQPLDGRSDVYALGVMLFEMATGRRPFEADTPYGLAVLQVTTPPPLPRTVNAAISPALESVILKALAKRREDRYTSAGALLEALRATLSQDSGAFVAPLMAAPPDTQPNTPPALDAYAPPPPLGTGYRDLAPHAPPLAPPQPTPPTSPQLVAVPRVPARRHQGGSLMLSIAIGMLVGCGLLVGLLAVALFVIQNSSRQEAQEATSAALTAAEASAVDSDDAATALAQVGGGGENVTPDGESIRPLVTNTPAVSSGAAPDANSTAGATERATNSATLAVPIPSLTPLPTVLLPTRPPTSAPRDIPFTGVAPVGERSDAGTGGAVTTANSSRLTALGVSGGLLYFDQDAEGNYDIFRVDLPGGGVYALTDHRLSDTYPAPSPDGRYIAFQSERDGDFDIFIMDADGDNETRVVQNAVTDRLPTWSPDGQWIYFSSDQRGDGSFDILRVRPDGSGLDMVFSDGARNSHVRVSPDGSALIFTSGARDDANTWEVRRFDFASRAAAFLTLNQIKDWSPTFAPDGSHILYLTTGSGFAAVARMTTTGDAISVVFDGSGYESAAAYSPDMQYIALAADATGRDEVYVMRADGTDVVQVTTSGGLYPQWVP